MGFPCGALLHISVIYGLNRCFGNIERVEDGGQQEHVHTYVVILRGRQGINCHRRARAGLIHDNEVLRNGRWLQNNICSIREIFVVNSCFDELKQSTPQSLGAISMVSESV